MNEPKKPSMSAAIDLLVASGAIIEQKTGAFLMPVSQGYRASVEYTKVIVKDESDAIFIND